MCSSEDKKLIAPEKHIKLRTPERKFCKIIWSKKKLTLCFYNTSWSQCKENWKPFQNRTQRSLSEVSAHPPSVWRVFSAPNPMVVFRLEMYTLNYLSNAKGNWVGRCGSRIPHRRVANPPGDAQYTILPNFQKKLHEIKKFLGQGGHAPVAPP